MIKKTKTNQQILVMLLSSLFIMQGCKKDEDLVPVPLPINEPELITTLKLEFTDSSNTSNKVTVIFKDPDGDGGNEPTQFDSLKLQANKTWFFETTLLNESVNPPENITEEILEEADDHLFVYSLSGINSTVQITDKDSKNLPLGLKGTWRTGGASVGNTTVILKHQPGIKDGSADKGETDVEVTFKSKIY
jgi:hypothetical protein